MNKKNLEMMKENLEKVLEEVKIELENEHFTENEKDDKDDKDDIIIDIDKLKKFLNILNDRNENDDCEIYYFVKFDMLWEVDMQDLTTTLLLELKDISTFRFGNQCSTLYVNSKNGHTSVLTNDGTEM